MNNNYHEGFLSAYNDHVCEASPKEAKLFTYDIEKFNISGNEEYYSSLQNAMMMFDAGIEFAEKRMKAPL